MIAEVDEDNHGVDGDEQKDDVYDEGMTTSTMMVILI